jgi:hypothetical protein
VEHEAFYSAAAQVIPVLLLTMVFQLRALREGEIRDQGDLVLNFVLLTFTLGLLILGEVAAFRALYEGHTNDRLRLVGVALALPSCSCTAR